MTPTLSALCIYPVKGLAGIRLEASEVTERGLKFDRRFLVVDAAGVALTQRDIPKMATVWTEVAGSELRLAAPDAGEVALETEPAGGDPLTVQVWASSCAAIAPSPEADHWLSEYLEAPCRLAYMPDGSRREVNAKYGGEGRIVSFADGFPLLVTGEDSLADLNARLARPVPMNRFRPNLVVAHAGAWAEDGWGDFRIGPARFRMAKPCGRCQVTTTDQATGEVTGPEPLATLSRLRDSAEFGARFGMNAVVLESAPLRVGDPVLFS